MAPTTVTLSNTSVPADQYIGATIGTLSSNAPDATFTLVDSAGGYVSLSGKRIRQEKQAAPKTIIVRASNAFGSVDVPISLTAPAASLPAGLFARWDTMDASKLTVAGGKVSQWVDNVAGYVLEQLTAGSQPSYDTVNTMNGYPTVSVAPGSIINLKASASAINDALKAMLNVANSAYTILAVIDVVNGAPSNARELLSWGNNNAGLTGGARNYLIWRQATGASTYSLLRGDTVNAITTSSAVLFPSSPATGKHVIALRSDGATATQGYDKSDGAAGAANNDGAVVADTFSLFNRAVSATTATGWEGRLAGLLIWNRQLTQTEVNTAMDLLAADFGLTMPGAPTYIDLSQYDLDYANEWDSGLPYNSDYATDMTAPNGWIPGYLGGKTDLGSNGALADEVGWYADPRHPRFAPYASRLIAIEDGVLKLRAIPRPAELSDLSLKNGQGNECTYLNGSLVSYGAFAAQYGYWETRVKYPPAGTGVFGADWMLPAAGYWLPSEWDNHEMLGAGSDTERAATLHTAPYSPLFANKDMKQPIRVTIPSRSADYQLYGFSVEPDSIQVIHNRKVVGTYAPYNGVVGLAVAAGGSGVLADNATADGTISIKAVSSDSSMQDASGSLTVVGGVVTAATVTFPGVKMPASPVWTRANGSAIGGGVSLTSTVANDPATPTLYHVMMYWLLAMQMGSFTGTPDGVTEYEMAVDYVRHYRKKIAAPAIAGGTDADAQAVFDRASALGSAFSAPKQTKFNDFVKAAKAWQLRFDTTPMGDGSGSDWDVTKLSIWDAIEHLYLFDFAETATQALIDLRQPGAGTDLIAAGSPVFNVGGGYDLGPSKSLTGPAVALSSLVKTTDSHIGIDIASISHTATSSVNIIGSGNNFAIRGSTSVTTIQLMAAFGLASPKPNEALGAGHHIAARGHRAAVHHFKGGALLRAGYYSGNSVATTGIGSMVIGGGSSCPTMTVKKAHWGRRLMPAEVSKLTELLAALYT